MRDMREGFKKAIDQYEEDEVRICGNPLSEREKELIEYGYIQCSLQIGYDIISKSESFMDGLQEMVLENDELKRQLEHSTEQWNIWCKAYNGLAKEVRHSLA